MKIVLLLLLVLPWGAYGQTITTIAGTGVQGYSGNGSGAIIAQMDNPYCVTGDAHGNIFIADAFNNLIRKINSSGIISNFAGTGYGAGSTSSVGGYTGDGGPATAAQLWEPCSVITDPAGNVYFSDRGNFVIRKVNAAGIITTIAGNGSNGFSGDGGPATNAKLYHPLGLAIDNSGNLYFADAGNKRIRKISTATGIITTFAGGGVSGYGDGGPATTAQLNIPGFICFNAAGDMLIPDWPDHRVRKVNTVGIISTIAGNGSGTDAGDGLSATTASVASPCAVICDASGNLYISNYTSCVIRKVNTSGVISTVVGTGSCGYSGDGGPAIGAQIKETAICSYVDAGGNLYIADSKNNRIRRVLYNNTAVNEINRTSGSVSIFPNPTSDKLSLSSATGIETVMVVNMLGQVLMAAYPMAAKEITLNVGSLPAGVYCVRVNGMYGGRFVKE